MAEGEVLQARECLCRCHAPSGSSGERGRDFRQDEQGPFSLNEMFRVGEVRKTYWAIVKSRPPQDEGELVDWLVRNEKQNKSYAYDTERPNAKKAILRYKLIAHSDNYYLLEIDLKTGRHHQIRCQLAKMGCPIKGDLKYGFDRSNKDGGISLHARSAEFIHPVSKENVRIVAPVPDDNLWKALSVDQ